MKLRIGSGYDIHRLIPNRKLILGGIHIPYELGEKGHSDGDVLIHAIIDALLGAIAQGDIGSHFPPSDPQYKDISSEILLETTKEIINKSGYKINNIDCTVILEKPKLSEYKDIIKKNLAKILNIDSLQISIKAKTKEGCDATGQQEAVESFASVLLIE